MTRRSVLLGCVLVGCAAVVGCSGIWFFGSDEDGLLCGADDGNPRCLDGFVCVQGQDELERCVRAGFKEQGEACTVPAECQTGLTCGDAYAALCPEGADEMSCALVNETDRGLRCRPICNPSELNPCGNNARCFAFGGQDAFCQEGTCSADSDCVVSGLAGLCIDITPNTVGRTGVCLERCDPLLCSQAGTCDCVGLDGEVDQTLHCANPPGEAISARTVCTEVGVVGEGEACDFGGSLCGRGLTCAPLQDGNFGCVRWCRVGGGNPACLGLACQQVAGDLGICQ